MSSPDYPLFYLDRRAAASGSGVIVATLESVGPDEVWIVDRVVITCTSGSSTTCRLHDDSTSDLGTVLDISLAGNLDVAEYPRGLVIAPGKTLAARWAAAAAGSVCTLRAVGWRHKTGGWIPF